VVYLGNFKTELNTVNTDLIKSDQIKFNRKWHIPVV